MERVLVTGGTGFLGVHLVRALMQRHYEVRVLSRNPAAVRGQTQLPVEAVAGDVTRPEDVRTAVEGCEGVFHLAAKVTLSAKEADEVFAVNVEGTRNVMQAALDAGVRRVVHVSMVGTLEGASDDSVVDETCPLRPSDVGTPYLDSKVRAERLVFDMARNGLPAVVVNPGGMIGPEDNFRSPSSALLKLFFHRINPFVVAWRLNLVDVRDVAEGIILAYRNGQSGERYILGGENTDTVTVFRCLREVTDFNRTIWPLSWEALEILSELSSLISQPLVEKSVATFYHFAFWASSEKAERELGYRHRTLGETLADAAAWYEATYLKPQPWASSYLAGE